MASIFISTGEPSGHSYGAKILRSLRNHISHLRAYSLFPNTTYPTNVTAVVRHSIPAAIGISEAFKSIKSFFLSLMEVNRFFEKHSPDLALLIDFPEVNMRIARLASRQNIPVVYFIPPQVWAWRPWRVQDLKKYTNCLIVILPFEKTFYESKGINAVFLGHPVVDLINDELSKSEPIEEYSNSIAVVPGSRKSELNHHVPLLKKVLYQLSSTWANTSIIVPAPKGMENTFRRIFLSHEFSFCMDNLKVVSENKYHVLQQCAGAIVASGTATLELACLDVPMVVFYRVSRISAAVGRLLIRAQFASLPNLIMRARLVPELLQDDAEPNKILFFFTEVMKNEKLLKMQKRGFRQIRERLGRPGVFNRIAHYIMEFLK